FINDPAVPVDDFGNRAEIFIQKMNDGVGGQLLADIRKLLDIREEDCEAAPLSLIGAGIDQPTHQPGIEEFSEGILQAISLPQLLDHAIEGLRQFADFIPGSDRNRLGIGACFNGSRTPDELTQTGHHPRRSDRTYTDTESAGCEK